MEKLSFIREMGKVSNKVDLIIIDTILHNVQFDVKYVITLEFLQSDDSIQM